MSLPRPERVLAFPDALATVLTHGRALLLPRAYETVSLQEAAGRVLAEPIHAERDQPPFPRSTRDGYAVRAADLASSEPLKVIGSIRAGEHYTGPPLDLGQALEIMTGAPVPAGADAVLMLEHAVLSETSGTTVHLAEHRSLTPGENVVPRAAEARQDAELIPAGRRLAAPEIALAASCGLAELNVFPQPTVAIVATGDELVELDVAPEPWQIRNSNSYALAALVREAGGQPHPLPIARDTRDDIDQRITQARASDLLLLSGGVSMGKYDLVEEVLANHGAEFLFTGTLIQPGKPLVFGRLPKNRKQETGSNRQQNTCHPELTTENRPLKTGEDKQAGDGVSETYNVERATHNEFQYFFGLPGNPVSTEVCFRLFVAPLLRALAGQTEPAPRFVEARLAKDVRGGARVTRFLPAILTSDWQSAEVELVPWQGSGDLAANARANCFAVLPIGPEAFAAGETIRVLLR